MRVYDAIFVLPHIGHFDQRDLARAVTPPHPMSLCCDRQGARIAGARKKEKASATAEGGFEALAVAPRPGKEREQRVLRFAICFGIILRYNHGKLE